LVADDTLRADVSPIDRQQMNELNDILAEATAKIDHEYFLLPIAGGPHVYRERVYCYELYHQMRSRWPPKNVCPYFLNGEVDKSGHALLNQRGFNGEKPDLLVHGPGGMDGNHAVIEVKPSNVDRSGIASDLTKLALFRNQGEYQRGLYLIYGNAANERLARRIKDAAASVEGSQGIEIWFHAEVHVQAALFCVL
jgi:hypothetical protein